MLLSGLNARLTVSRGQLSHTTLKQPVISKFLSLAFKTAISNLKQNQSKIRDDDSNSIRHDSILFK